MENTLGKLFDSIRVRSLPAIFAFAAFVFIMPSVAGNAQDDIEETLSEAEVQIIGSNYQQAMNLLEPLRESGIENARLELLTGDALGGLGRVEEAQSHYRKALDIEPDNFFAHMALGEIAFSDSAWEEARQHFEKAIKSNPDSVVALNYIGCALTSLGETEKAKDYLLHAIDIDDDYSDSYLNLGTVMVHERNYQEAIKYLDKAISLDPESYIAYSNLSFALYMTGRYDESMTAIERAVEINPEDRQVLENLSFLANELDNIKNRPSPSTALSGEPVERGSVPLFPSSIQSSELEEATREISLRLPVPGREEEGQAPGEHPEETIAMASPEPSSEGTLEETPTPVSPEIEEAPPEEPAGNPHEAVEFSTPVEMAGQQVQDEPREEEEPAPEPAEQQEKVQVETASAPEPMPEESAGQPEETPEPEPAQPEPAEQEQAPVPQATTIEVARAETQPEPSPGEPPAPVKETSRTSQSAEPEQGAAQPQTAPESQPGETAPRKWPPPSGPDVTPAGEAEMKEIPEIGESLSPLPVPTETLSDAISMIGPDLASVYEFQPSEISRLRSKVPGVLYYVDMNNFIWRYQPKQHAMQKIFEGTNVDCSRTSPRIVYSDFVPGGTEIYTYHFPSSTLTTIHYTQNGVRDLELSPDSSAVSFVAVHPDFSRTLKVIFLGDLSTATLPDNIDFENYSWNPSDGTIVFAPGECPEKTEIEETCLAAWNPRSGSLDYRKYIFKDRDDMFLMLGAKRELIFDFSPSGDSVLAYSGTSLNRKFYILDINTRRGIQKEYHRPDESFMLTSNLHWGYSEDYTVLTNKGNVWVKTPDYSEPFPIVFGQFVDSRVAWCPAF